MSRDYGRKWHGHRSVPRPPRDLEQQMEAAGRDGDQARLDLLAAQYDAWLAEQGYTGRGHRGTTAPDAAYLPEPDEDDA